MWPELLLIELKAACVRVWDRDLNLDERAQKLDESRDGTHFVFVPQQPLLPANIFPLTGSQSSSVDVKKLCVFFSNSLSLLFFFIYTAALTCHTKASLCMYVYVSSRKGHTAYNCKSSSGKTLLVQLINLFFTSDDCWNYVFYLFDNHDIIPREHLVTF